MTDETAPQAPFVDDPTVREVYVDVVQVIATNHGVIRFDLSVQRHNKVPPICVERIVPAVRFVCGLESARNLKKLLEGAIEETEKHAALVQAPAVSLTKN
jgi:hypothetical protein